MKSHLTVLSLALLSLSAPALALEEGQAVPVTEQLSGVLSEAEVAAFYQSNPESVLDILTQLLVNPNVDPQLAISEALVVAPEQLQQIADLARTAGISNEVITTAALLAGVDPTAVAEATAAGIANPVAALSPPAAPAVGSNGGGGAGVVSPN
ncbi:hypothetical protein [Vibrio panuliri]|uniref:Uncharacterized protein n=1 Tax=Vibrio panuliri TaxID=1381081 RepID=A0ABX3FH10_9VIBR|nr:hypothetical protein [Vibrio panuliri]KAB1457243.1 hypothetical protein F7O85_05705 [Vibrio panuliri]OLQ92506.1 hypothetical protein BIY20_08485 [Vibrio panuliri]